MTALTEAWPTLLARFLEATKLTKDEASQIAGVSVRQFERLLSGHRFIGAESLINLVLFCELNEDMVDGYQYLMPSPTLVQEILEVDGGEPETDETPTQEQLPSMSVDDLRKALGTRPL